jgi:hypothetical protein
MDRNWIPKQALKYELTGRINIGRLRNNGRTNFTFRVKEQVLHLALQS